MVYIMGKTVRTYNAITQTFLGKEKYILWKWTPRKDQIVERKETK